MKLKTDTSQFRFDPTKNVRAHTLPTAIEPLYDSKKEYKEILEDLVEDLHDHQRMMYADDRYSLLLVFQGMDTSGKDSSIRNVMSGVNPAGVQVFSFKKPTDQELDHDWMWRTTRSLPERGRIGIFNRSYYEEVLVVKVHPEIVREYQPLPDEVLPETNEELFRQRYADINHFEDYLWRNGTRVIKFFLHISRDEQRDRLIARIDEPEKNWKFSMSDVKERKHWDEYQEAFSDCIAATSTERAPWYVVPGNDKKNARLIIADIIRSHFESLDMQYPEVSDEFRLELLKAKEDLLKD